MHLSLLSSHTVSAGNVASCSCCHYLLNSCSDRRLALCKIQCSRYTAELTCPMVNHLKLFASLSKCGERKLAVSVRVLVPNQGCFEVSCSLYPRSISAARVDSHSQVVEAEGTTASSLHTLPCNKGKLADVRVCWLHS